MELETSEGQAELDPTGATSEAPGSGGEQSVALSQTTSNGSGSGDVELFYDPKSIEGKPELELLAKQLQGDYTKKTMGLAEGQQKVDAYDAFMADPEGTMRQLATQYGWNLIQGKASPEADGEFNPKTWDEVQKHFLNAARKELARENAPLINEVKDLKKQNVEAQLDRDYPDWRTYESNMSDTLQRHPTLVNDTDALYRMSVPKELLEQRATKTALAKLKGGTDNAQISDNKTTSIPTTDSPTKPLTFEEAAKRAKAIVLKSGLSAPLV